MECSLPIGAVPALCREFFLSDGVGDGQVAAGGQLAAILRDDLVRFGLVGDEVQRACAQHGDRLG
jgi:hypothetical protein